MENAKDDFTRENKRQPPQDIDYAYEGNAIAPVATATLESLAIAFPKLGTFPILVRQRRS